jgi:hypothetical protein
MDEREQQQRIRYRLAAIRPRWSGRYRVVSAWWCPTSIDLTESDARYATRSGNARTTAAVRLETRSRL